MYLELGLLSSLNRSSEVWRDPLPIMPQGKTTKISKSIANQASQNQCSYNNEAAAHAPISSAPILSLHASHIVGWGYCRRERVEFEQGSRKDIMASRDTRIIWIFLSRAAAQIAFVQKIAMTSRQYRDEPLINTSGGSGGGIVNQGIINWNTSTIGGRVGYW